MIELHLGGHLSFYAPQKQSRFSVPIDQPTDLEAILQKLGVPLAEVAIVAVNGELVDLAATRVNPGDRIELYPPMGGG
jgi:sulfur carrier protein ThiS